MFHVHACYLSSPTDDIIEVSYSNVRTYASGLPETGR